MFIDSISTIVFIKCVSNQIKSLLNEIQKQCRKYCILYRDLVLTCNKTASQMLLLVVITITALTSPTVPDHSISPAISLLGVSWQGMTRR